jgi:cytochrome c-type biogenesis protein CcmH
MAVADTAGKGWKVSRLLLLVAVAIAVIAVVYAVTQGKSGRGAPPPAATPAPDSAASTDPETVIHALQEQVGANPNDAEGWKRLGQAYYLTERYPDAARSYRRATALTPRDGSLWSAYGEATVMASQHDPMPKEALEAFRKAVAIDAKDARARYFLAVARDLGGDHKGALDDWFALLADTPAGAPWESDLRRTIEQVGRINNLDVASRLAAVKPAAPAPGAAASAMLAPAGDPVATGAIPGPSPEQMHAASAMPKGAQDQMVQGMVGRLEAKLKDDPKNVDGWIMLMRSRVTLGETAKAAAARDAAVAANPGAAARIKGAASTLGVPGS